MLIFEKFNKVINFMGVFKVDTFVIISIIIIMGPRAPVAQLDRASDYESAGWGFESLQARL